MHDVQTNRAHWGELPLIITPTFSHVQSSENTHLIQLWHLQDESVADALCEKLTVRGTLGPRLLESALQAQARTKGLRTCLWVLLEVTPSQQSMGERVKRTQSGLSERGTMQPIPERNQPDKVLQINCHR
eukprot:1142854-Pelagomonas_calceolata.AAC.4